MQYNKLAFFDTETNGMLSPKLTMHDRLQGQIVQVACLLTDLEGNELRRYTSLIQPEFWDMPDYIEKIHGISATKAAALGRPRSEVLAETQAILSEADVIVAHNYDFDSRMAFAEEERDEDLGREPAFRFPRKRCCCTMKELTEIVKATKANGQRKWPKLMEAYMFAFGKPFEGAHDALTDVLATRDLFVWAVKQGHIKL